MATKKNLNQCGWFYHTSYKRPEDADDIIADLPPASQIPGLSDLPDEIDDAIGKPVFRDTDSKYVRLAKQGGRADLLRFRENVPNTQEAKPYHRSDWFYLEDNALADAQEPSMKENMAFDFFLPEYMVHQEYKPRGGMDDIDNALYHQKQRAPYACDSINVFQREGNTVTDKTLRLPEVHRAGNRRSNKPKIKHYPVPEKIKGPPQEIGQAEKTLAKKYQEIPAFKDNDKAMMGKLLSNSYEHEYKDMLEKWQNKNRGKGDKHVVVHKGDHSAHSEYQSVFARQNSQDKKLKVNKHSAGIITSKRRSSQDEDGFKAGYRQTVDAVGQNDAKDLFKLSRFKNIPSKVDSHPHQRQSQHTNHHQHHSPPHHLVAAGAH